MTRQDRKQPEGRKEGRRKDGWVRTACGKTGERGCERERDAGKEICHLLYVPPAPLSCTLPGGGKHSLMSEGDLERRDAGGGREKIGTKRKTE